ncbi:S8 family serine peptidase [Dyadobacter bucti]|uniref:S8 family serine peptidase n=1 Tax=Dyadobacter bucti TaxID=2572203 RepID=UPI001109B515|nr:S8 family serine peptidase [Dyadobacter bucti]
MKTFPLILKSGLTFTLIFFLSQSDANAQPSEKEPYIYHGYNLLLPKGFGSKQLIDLIRTKLFIDISKHVRQCPCDTALINIDYPGLEFNGHDRVQVKTRNGQGDDIEIDLNVKGLMAEKNSEFSTDAGVNPISMKNETVVDSMLKASFNPNFKKTKKVKLAIFDSGIDKELTKLDYIGVTSVVASCLPQLDTFDKGRDPFGQQKPADSRRIIGLNFAPKDETGDKYNVFNITDHGSTKHGTRVAFLIAEQFKKSQTKGVQLLIMKVLNKYNKGDGYGIMCAMYHAKLLGAEIMNFSLGYYGPEDLIFRKYINDMKLPRGYQSKYERPIWIVSAAGNAMEQFEQHVDSNDERANITADISRDLDLRNSKFYPAYFSKDIKNVISVTTVKDDLLSVCDGQNYDRKSLNIGVKATNCLFAVGTFLEINGIWEPRSGTSFAAPVVAGWIGTKSKLFVGKDQILEGASISKPLERYILLGKFINP